MIKILTSIIHRKILFLISFVMATAMITSAQDHDYPIQPVPFTSVKLTDNFWEPKIKVNHDVTIPHALLQSKNRITNFEIAAKLKSGRFASSYPFDDSDVYKIIEAASYSLHYFPDAKLEAQIDSLISIIALAQEPDGYLYTCRTMNSFPNDWSGTKRWQNESILSHETYNLGHLFESACAYFQATGKDKYLKIAIKAADLLDKDFGWGKLQVYPGHQIVEVGLARLYRITGDIKYLNLAKFFLDVRGPGGEEYCQAQAKVINQTEAVGHAVRAVYMYAGMADVAALKNEPSYISAIDKIWNDIIHTKLYITGGIGASGGNEGFNGAYNLPNSSAYCETCASVGNIYLNQRLFLLHGDAKYIDILERTLYNSLLSGISLSGDRFFYPNRLMSSGNQTRSVWFDCACCPPNISRLIPSVPGYIYAQTADTLYVNLFMDNTTSVSLNGTTLEVVQKTNYPWNGNIGITLNPEQAKSFTVKVRIPGWARNEPVPGDLYKFQDENTNAPILKVNGQQIEYVLVKGYAVVKQSWKKGDVITLDLPMSPRKVVANASVNDDKDRMSVQRGPMVYCAEGADNGGKVLSVNLGKNVVLTDSYEAGLLNGTEVIKTNAMESDGSKGREIKLIPYFLWANRGGSEMAVWLSAGEPKVLPDSLVIIDDTNGNKASTNYVSTWENLSGIYDLYDPANSGDKGQSAFGNWAYDSSTVGAWNWVQYTFPTAKTISSSEVYWWDDNQGITLPDSCYLSYFNETSKKFVRISSTNASLKSGGIKSNTYNYTHFKAVNATQIRLNFLGNLKAQGILEWKIYTPSKITSSNLELPAPCRFHVYPNPVTDQLTIESSGTEKSIIEIYNTSGALVYSSSFSGSTRIKNSEIGTKNMYILKISISGASEFRKIVIN
jgi:DUF1680 family protein